MKNPNVVYAEKMAAEYAQTTNKVSKVTALQKLDKKVKQPAEIFAFTFGIIGTLIMGTGMSIVMKVIGNFVGQMAVGVVIGLIGIAMVIANYFIYKNIVARGKKKYAFEIVELAKQIVEEEGTDEK